jgi:hypothetical protein
MERILILNLYAAFLFSPLMTVHYFIYPDFMIYPTVLLPKEIAEHPVVYLFIAAFCCSCYFWVLFIVASGLNMVR